MKSKNSTVQYDLNKEIRLVLSKHFVKFASKDGKWEMSFGSDTIEYSQILYLISKKELSAIQNLSAFLYFTKLIVSNVDFCNKYNDLLKDFLKGTEIEKPADEKEDAEILAEEKIFHEKTPEAVNELEALKENEQ